MPFEETCLASVSPAVGDPADRKASQGHAEGVGIWIQP
jgi:hypothetical protein